MNPVAPLEFQQIKAVMYTQVEKLLKTISPQPSSLKVHNYSNLFKFRGSSKDKIFFVQRIFVLIGTNEPKKHAINIKSLDPEA